MFIVLFPFMFYVRPTKILLCCISSSRF